MVIDVSSIEDSTEDHLHQKCQIQDCQNRTGCQNTVLLLQPKPKLGPKKTSTEPHAAAGSGLDIAASDTSPSNYLLFSTAGENYQLQQHLVTFDVF